MSAVMPLRLSYPDKYRLWNDLVRGSADRVFVPAEEPLRIGARVPIQVALPDLALPIVVTGAVVGRRSKSARFATGVYVRFPEEEVEKCRRFLGLKQSPERYQRGRKDRRVRCELPARFRSPAVETPCVVKNISSSGALVTCPVALISGQRVELELTLDDGLKSVVAAEVSWAARGREAVGLKFVDLPEPTQMAVGACVLRLARAMDAQRGANTIVIADDDAEILAFLAQILNKHGYEPHQATRGDEALELVRELGPRLVILDILMPAIDGVDVCKMMRADVELVDIPVIFLSALEPQTLHEVADEAGATDYLTKPVMLADLINMVGTYLK